MSLEEEFLSLFGWNDFFKSQKLNPAAINSRPARVICEERNLYRLQIGMTEAYWAAVSGKLQFHAKGRVDYPAVGDWVMLEASPQVQRGIIHQVLERKTIVFRKQVGESADMQILSSNVDYAFITTSANADLNIRRIERYLSVVHQAGVQPIILITKADTCLDQIDQVKADVQNHFPNIPVHSLSKNNFAKELFLQEYLKKGTTSVFMGSSGVGKSTVVNFLIESDLIKTQEVREADDKGRHTTTSRNLYVSRYGGLIIDTPGMRELQLSDHAEGIQTHFADIEDLMKTCKFNDCKHLTEPGCAILKALEIGTLEKVRWQSYLKLEAEVQQGMNKIDKVLANYDRKMWKKKSIENRKKN